MVDDVLVVRADRRAGEQARRSDHTAGSYGSDHFFALVISARFIPRRRGSFRGRIIGEDKRNTRQGKALPLI